MSKKHESISSEIALGTSENLIKKVLESVVSGLTSDFIQAIPFVPVIKAGISAISNLKEARYHNNLISFFDESQESKEFAEVFFTNKSNAEIGLEILSLVEQTNLSCQAEMLARITRMWKQSKRITKEQFDEYANIILSFDNHLIRQFEKYMTYKEVSYESNSGIQIDRMGIKLDNPIDEMFIYPNMHFVTYGFLRRKQNRNMVIGNAFQQEGHYSITDKAHFFYNNIFKDQKNTTATAVNYNMF